MTRTESSSPPSRYKTLLAWASAWVAFASAVLGAASTSQWREDALMLRALEHRFELGHGNLFVAAWSLVGRLPFGPVEFRGALLSAAAMGWAGWVLYKLALRYCGALAWSSFLTPTTAALTSLTVTLGAVARSEATVAGSSALPVALVLTLFAFSTGTLRFAAGRAPRYVILAALLTLLAFENLTLACLGSWFLVAERLQNDRFNLPRRWVICFPAALTCLLLVSIVGRLAPHGWPWSLLTFLPSPPDEAGTLPPPWPVVLSWHDSLSLSFALALGGLTLGLVSPAARLLAWPLALLLLADLLTRAGGRDTLDLNAVLSLRLLGASALALGVAQVLHVGLLRWARHPNPLLRTASAVCFLALVGRLAFAVDDGFDRVDRSLSGGAEAWTQESLLRLPPSALLLLRSSAAATRLQVAQKAHHQRPDVRVIPFSWLGDASTAARLVQHDPGFAPLLRDLSADGTPSEYALAQLAEKQPVYMDLSPSWGKHTLTHLVPESGWLRFLPHPAGASDRRAAWEAEQRTSTRILYQAQQEEGVREQATMTQLLTHTREVMTLARLLNDVRTQRQAEEFLLKIEGKEPGLEPPPTAAEVRSALELPRSPTARN